MERHAFISASIGVLSGMGRAQVAPKALHRSTARAFGAELTITVLHTDEARAQAAIAAALCAALHVERMTALTEAESAVSRLNRDGMLDQPDPQLLALLSQACALSDLTAGAFDVTVQPVLRVYAEALRWSALPERHAIESARARVGWRRLAFGREQVRFLQAEMAVTLDGLAQGYAADMALSVLRRHGIRDALVDTGAVAATGCEWLPKSAQI